MPISGATVGFQYINSTTAYTIDQNTVYFDNINGNMKVGSTVIAERNVNPIKISYNLTAALPTINTVTTINTPTNDITIDDLINNIDNIELEITGPQTGEVMKCKTFYYDGVYTPLFTFGPFLHQLANGIFKATIEPNLECKIEKLL